MRFMKSRYRNRELLLLIFALIIISLGFYLSAQTTAQPIDTALKLAGLLATAFIGLHIANRILITDADPLLLSLTAFTSGIGLVMIWRLKPNLASAQSTWILVGAVTILIALVLARNYRKLKEYKYTWAIAGIILLFAPIFLGTERGGARLWLDLGPISFQPAEIAKICFVFFLAAYLEEKRELLSISTKRAFGLWLPEPKHLGPLAVMWLISLIILVLERDLGTSLLFFGLFLAMIYVATGRAMYVSLGISLFIAGAVACYFVFSHVQTRFDIWLDPWIDPAGRGYQLIQAIFAIGSGGLTGTGLGLGHPTLIPAVQTDFIFAAVAEELGLLGGVAVILAYLLFISRGLRIALSASDDFGRLVATGLTSVFALQAFVILGGTTRLIPLTGVTLPYMSYGGSSILMNFILLALLLAISAKRGDSLE
ncbi:MAG: FtsW/RodA/SpoVE family cell cycle protein [Actinobacteria bacterium]|nr:FtsW/RodA/SpoVE family cell cycle protein [Actinomycetota bacterium]